MNKTTRHNFELKLFPHMKSLSGCGQLTPLKAVTCVHTLGLLSYLMVEELGMKTLPTFLMSLVPLSRFWIPWLGV